MKNINPLLCALTLTINTAAYANVDNFFHDSTLVSKFKVNYYDLEGEYDKTTSLVPGIDYDVEMSIEDFGASFWFSWQSGWFNDFFGVEMGYQIAEIAWEDGTIDMQDTTTGLYSNPLNGGVPASYAQFYSTDTDASSVGKLGNANIRLRYGDDDNHIQLLAGRFTPTIYNLLHRPDITYYALSQVYEGASLTGNLTWSWGTINPWFNYFTGYSNEQSEETVRFRDLETTTDSLGYTYDPFDAIYNIGFHTVTDYFTSSASYSYAEDYLSNGIIEVYSGIPLSMLGFNTNDEDYYIKYLVKYGSENGLGEVNEDHSTDVTEFAIGMQAGNLDFLAGVTQIGDESFTGFETQDGYTAGGGTAVWGDMALLNKFDYANQQTLFLIGGYDLDAINLPHWRLQANILVGSDIDTDALSTADSIMVNQEDYTETVIDLIYGKNGYQGQGMSYRLTYGQDDNFNAKGIGLFIEYNGDLLKAFN